LRRIFTGSYSLPPSLVAIRSFTILLVGRVFNGYGVVSFADFTAFLHFALALLWNIYKSRRGDGLETNFAMSSCSKQLG
jgi:hypothetical protein